LADINRHSYNRRCLCGIVTAFFARHFPYELVNSTPARYGPYDGTICGSISGLPFVSVASYLASGNPLLFLPLDVTGKGGF
jgi:hypothetical protein